MADKIGGVVITRTGGIMAGASVSVTDHATGAPVALYSDIGLTSPRGNPTATNSRGKWHAYVPAGIYDVRAFNDVDEDIDEYVQVS